MFKQKFLFTLLLFGMGQFVGAEELQWLQYHSSNQASQIVGDMGTQYIDLSDNKPEGVELPEFKSSGPIFAKWKSKNGKMIHIKYYWFSHNFVILVKTKLF